MARNANLGSPGHNERVMLSSVVEEYAVPCENVLDASRYVIGIGRPFNIKYYNL